MLSQIGLEKFDFLRKKALKMGAVDAKIITADKVVVEDRIVLKCKVGCPNYGKRALLSLSGQFTNINSWLYYYFLELDVIVRELFEQISKYGNTQN